MRANPYIEKILVKSPGKKDAAFYNINCNEYRMADINEEQLLDIYNMIGEFLAIGGKA